MIKTIFKQDPIIFLIITLCIVVQGQQGQQEGELQKVVYISSPKQKNSSWISLYDGIWGDWQPEFHASIGYYACGAHFRREANQGGGGISGHDDTAGNGLKLTFCKADNWLLQEVQTIYEGLWGTWNEFKCPENQFIRGGQVRFEKPQGTGNNQDDTALNGLKVLCSDPVTFQSQWYSVNEGEWGDWQAPKEATFQYVCGAQVRFEPAQGEGKRDDTAMNGIKFKFCDMKYLKYLTFAYDLNNVFPMMVPLVISNGTGINPTNQTGKTTLTIDQVYTNKKTWISSESINITQNINLWASVPKVAGLTYELNSTYEKNWGFNKEETEQIGIKNTWEVPIPPCSVISTSVIFWTGYANINFLATYVYTDGTQDTVSGVWQGVHFNNYELRITILDSGFCRTQCEQGVSLRTTPISSYSLPGGNKTNIPVDDISVMNATDRETVEAGTGKGRLLTSNENSHSFL